MDKEVSSGPPPKPGYYRAWDLASGYSEVAYWDGEKWTMPEGFPIDPNWGLVIDNWMEI